MILIDTSFGQFDTCSYGPTLALSGLPKSISYCQTLNAKLHISALPASTKGDITLQLIGIESTAASRWKSGQPHRRTFLCAQTTASLSGVTMKGGEYILPISVQTPTFELHASEFPRLQFPPTVRDASCSSPTSVSVQYFLRAYLPSAKSFAQKEVVLVVPNTGFDFADFLDASGGTLARRYRESCLLKSGRLNSKSKGEVILEGNPIFAIEGQASFHLELSGDVSLDGVAYEIVQKQCSSLAGVKRILDETGTVNVRKVSLVKCEVANYSWDSKTSELVFAYDSIPEAVPNYVSELTAITYEFVVSAKVGKKAVKLSVPFQIGKITSTPPPYD